MNYFENIIIGSSPISLINAILLHKKNNRVLIIDKEQKLGGSWQIGKYKSLSYDLGCHFLVPFDLDIKNKSVVKILSSLNIEAEITNTSVFFERKIEEIKNYDQHYKYIKIKGGYASIIETLIGKVNELNIDIICDQIHSVRFDGVAVELKSPLKSYWAKKLYLPSYIDIDKIDLPDTCISLDAEYLDSQHIVLILEGKWERNHHDYYFLKETETCHFDKLSHYSTGQKHLFNIRIGRKSKSKSDAQLYDEVIYFISKLGFRISREILKHRHVYELAFRSEKRIREIQEDMARLTSHKIEILYTRNLTQALLELGI